MTKKHYLIDDYQIINYLRHQSIEDLTKQLYDYDNKGEKEKASRAVKAVEADPKASVDAIQLHLKQVTSSQPIGYFEMNSDFSDILKSLRDPKILEEFYNRTVPPSMQRDFTQERFDDWVDTGIERFERKKKEEERWKQVETRMQWQKDDQDQRERQQKELEQRAVTWHAEFEVRKQFEQEYTNPDERRKAYPLWKEGMERQKREELNKEPWESVRVYENHMNKIQSQSVSNLTSSNPGNDKTPESTQSPSKVPGNPAAEQESTPKPGRSSGSG